MKTKVLRLLAVLLCAVIAMPSLAAPISAEASEADLAYAEKAALTAEKLSVRHDTVFGVRALFRVNYDAIALLEKTYKLEFGAVAGLGGEGKYTAATLLLNESGLAPDNAKKITVYATDKAVKTDGHFLSDKKDAFAVTLRVGDADQYHTETVIRGFMILTDKGGASHTVYFDSEADSVGASYEAVALAEYRAETSNEDKLKCYTDCMQKQLKQYYDTLASYPVLTCGVNSASELNDNGKAVWVQYLPDRDPWIDSADEDYTGIKAIYMYYPCSYDPSEKTEAELKELGAIRVFAYIGAPAEAERSAGIVCVHGGEGQAYANYTLEAVKNGFAAIAFDTEGCHNMTGGTVPYSESPEAYQKDELGHGGKDNFDSEGTPLDNQWLYYSVGDTVLANSVLRSYERADSANVGVTGISWGGLTVSTTICYDYRFAFCVPVYLSFHMAESTAVGVGELKSRPLSAALWQSDKLLASSPVPTMIISSANDLFASINTAQSSYETLQNGMLIIKPELFHSLPAGASSAEIYRFGRAILGISEGFIVPETMPTAEDGRDLTVRVSVPDDIKKPSATIYYRTEPIGTYNDPKELVWESVPMTYDREAGSVSGKVPDDAVMYYISFNGTSRSVQRKKNHTPYLKNDKYTVGSVYSSTPVIVLSGSMIAEN